MSHRTSLALSADPAELSWQQMNVPGAQFAQIDRAKIEDYLLSPFHPVGRFKSIVFSALGYSRDDWQLLDADLRAHLEANVVVERQQTAFGLKYVVGGNLLTPSGAVANLVTVWIILEGEHVPRFVTAYPGER